jgi:ABC-type nickel/cobalt efflux system permease component RcnA
MPPNLPALISVDQWVLLGLVLALILATGLALALAILAIHTLQRR